VGGQVVVEDRRERAEARHGTRSEGLTGATGWRASLAAIDADAALDGLRTSWSRTVAWLPFAGTVVLGAVYAVRPRLYYWLLLEDHPVEWAQFAFLAFAVLAAVLAAVRLARRGRPGAAALLILAALAAVVLAGEEISWGERVFSLAPPADLSSINRQGELNVHNLVVDSISVDTVSKVIELVLAVGAAALALLARPVRGVLAGTWLRDLAPPLATVPAFGLLALYQVVMLGSGAIAAPAILYQEWMEFGLYLGIAVTVACVWLRAGGAPVGAGALAWRPLAVAALVALAVTGTFAQLSAQSKVLPGNVPPTLRSLYGSF
jgi:hypothetical protein